MFIRIYFLCLFLMGINSFEYWKLRWDPFKSNLFLDYPDISYNLTIDGDVFLLEVFKSYLSNPVFIVNEKKISHQFCFAIIDTPQSEFLTNKMIDKMPYGFYVDLKNKNFTSIGKIEAIIKEKYNLVSTYNTIGYLNPTKIQCKIVFNSDNQEIVIDGLKQDLQNSNSIRILFYSPEQSKKRVLFEEELKKTNSNMSLKCDYLWNAGKVLSVKKLTMTPDQTEKLGLVQKLFGESEKVYVTRNQIAELANEIYEELNIFADYEIWINDFQEIFIDEFIKQTENSTFSDVDFDEAISNLSMYNLKDDSKSNDIKFDLSKIFKIKKFYWKILIEFDQNEYNNFTSKYEMRKGSVFGCLDKLTSDFSFRINNDEFYDELNFDMNQLRCENKNIEWSRKDDLIYPKTIKTVKINRSSLGKNLTFNKIIQLIRETYLYRNITLKRPTFAVKNIKEFIFKRTINRILVLPNGNLLVVDSSYIDILDSNDGSVIKTFFLGRIVPYYNNEIAILSNDFIAVSSHRDYIVIFDLMNQSIKSRLEDNQDYSIGHSNIITLTALSNGYLASVSRDNKIRIWYWETKTLVRKLEGYSRSLLTVLPNGDFAFTYHENTIKILNSKDDSIEKILTGHADSILSLVVLPNGNLVSGSQDQTIKIWNPNDGSLIRTISNQDFIDKNRILLAVLPNGYIVCNYGLEGMKILDPIDGSLKSKFSTGGFDSQLTVLPNGNFVTLSTQTSTPSIKIWSLK